MLEYLSKVFERTLNNCAFYCQMHSWEHLLNEVGVLRGISYCISDDIILLPDFLGSTYYKEFLFYCAVGDYFKDHYEGFFDDINSIKEDLLDIRFDIEKEDPK